MLGSYARIHKLFERRVSNVIIWVLFLLLIWCWAILGYNGFSMAMCSYGETAIDFLRNIAGAIASTVFIVGTLYRFENSSMPCGRIASGMWNSLSRLGQITIYVLCIHIFEDNFLPWGLIVELTQTWSPEFVWLVISIIRIAADIAFTLVAKDGTKFVAQRISRFIAT